MQCCGSNLRFPPLSMIEVQNFENLAFGAINLFKK
jgi:hypothetical protein